jgi:hypothetical protein
MLSVGNDTGVQAADESSADPRRLFDRLSRDHADQAHVRRFRLLGRQLHLNTVGENLHAHLTSALAHLKDTDAAPAPGDLAAYMWDTETTGVDHPYHPLTGVPDGPEHLDVSADDRTVRDLRGQWAAELDRIQGEIVGCTRFAAPRPLLHDLGKPLQTLIAVWARDLGIPLVHAGMVARGGNGVLLGGAGGAGKSTTSLACVDSGFDFLGDDRIGLEADAGNFIGHSIYGSALVDQRQLEQFPALAGAAVAPRHPTRERKPLVFLNEVCPGQLVPTTRVRAVALPRIGEGRTTRIRPAKPAEALRIIAPSSLILPLGPGPLGMSRLAALVRTVPSYWLDLGTDLDGVAAGVDRILSEATG